MKPKRPSKTKAIQPAAPSFDGLLHGLLREFIAESRRLGTRISSIASTSTDGRSIF